MDSIAYPFCWAFVLVTCASWLVCI